jgi:hypothetical protein
MGLAFGEKANQIPAEGGTAKRYYETVLRNGTTNLA